jgi:hypothetical protein
VTQKLRWPVSGLAAHSPDCEPELLDTKTGRAIGPGALIRWREEMAARIGF